MRRRRISILVAMLIACSVLASCTGRVDPANLASQYLRAVSSGMADYGWSLLHPDTRAALFGNDYLAYEDQVRAADWSRFEWMVPNGAYDEPYLYVATVEFSGGADSVPALLREGRGEHGPILSSDGTSPIGSMMVRIDAPAGDVGVWASP